MDAVTTLLTLPLTTQYKLPEADRLAILAQAPGPHQQSPAVTTAKIARERGDFIAAHGCPFGTVLLEDQYEESERESPRTANTPPNGHGHLDCSGY